jgi:hypothetical protein
MSGSSDSSGGKTISSAEVEDLKKIVRELSQLGQLRAGDHETTPTGAQRSERWGNDPPLCWQSWFRSENGKLSQCTSRAATSAAV